MQRSGFKPPSKEKIAEINQKKRDKALAKAKTPRQKPKTAPRAKKKAPSIRILKAKLWREVKRITRERHLNTCYTCGATGLEGSNLQSGHGKAMGALPLRFKYDIRNIRVQCMRCNLHLGGCQDIFIAKLEQEEEGLQFLNEACYLDEESNAWRIKGGDTIGGKDATHFVEMLLAQYKTISYDNKHN